MTKSDIWNNGSATPSTGREILVCRNDEIYYGKYIGGKRRYVRAEIRLTDEIAETFALIDYLADNDKWAYLEDFLNLSSIERTGKDCKAIANSAKNSKNLQENEELEQEIEQYMNHNYYVDEDGVICDRNHPRLDFCEDKFKEVARHFANWQKQQMMKNAVQGFVSAEYQNVVSVKSRAIAGEERRKLGLHLCAKIKLIIIKEC